MRRLLVPLLMLSMLPACFPRTARPPGEPTPDELDAVKTRWPDTTQESLEKGWHLFIDNCDHCHGYPDLTYLKPEEWPSAAERMGKKAELDANDIATLTRWIAAAYPKPAQTSPSK